MLVCAASLAWAQAPGRRAAVTTKQGDRIEGAFVSADQKEVVLQVAGRRLTLPLDDVSAISFVAGEPQPALSVPPAAAAPAAVGAPRAAAVPQPAAVAPSAGIPQPVAAAPPASAAPVSLIDDAFRALAEINAATDKGVRRDQYPDLLRRTIPRIEAFVKSPGHSYADVRLLMTAAVNDYVAPFGTGTLISTMTLWTTSSPVWRDATAKVAHARELAAQPGEESHWEDPAEQGISTSAQVSGRLGSGDRVMKETVDRATAGAFNDVYRLTLDRPTKITVALNTHECPAHLTLTDDAGKAIASSGRAGESTRIAKDLKPGVYHVWAGTQRPNEVGTYQLTVAGK